MLHPSDIKIGDRLYCFIDLEATPYQNPDLMVCSILKVLDILGDGNPMLHVETVETTDNKCVLARKGAQRMVYLDRPLGKHQIVGRKYDDWHEEVQQYISKKMEELNSRKRTFEISTENALKTIKGKI